jgi:hypothetical protein
MEGPMTVTKIAEKTPGITQSALALLRASGILDNEKTGRNISYFIADPRVKEIIRTLRKYYCKNGEEIK